MGYLDEGAKCASFLNLYQSSLVIVSPFHAFARLIHHELSSYMDLDHVPHSEHDPLSLDCGS